MDHSRQHLRTLNYHLQQAIKNNPKFILARMNLGIVYSEDLGDFDAAIEQYDAIINNKYRTLYIPKIYNNKKSTKDNMGVAYYNKGLAYRLKSIYLPSLQSNPFESLICTSIFCNFSLVTFVIFITLFGGHGFDPRFISAHLAGGGLMLGAFFMATDYVTSPITKKGQ